MFWEFLTSLIPINSWFHFLWQALGCKELSYIIIIIITNHHHHHHHHPVHAKCLWESLEPPQGGIFLIQPADLESDGFAASRTSVGRVQSRINVLLNWISEQARQILPSTSIFIYLQNKLTCSGADVLLQLYEGTCTPFRIISHQNHLNYNNIFPSKWDSSSPILKANICSEQNCSSSFWAQGREMSIFRGWS